MHSYTERLRQATEYSLLFFLLFFCFLFCLKSTLNPCCEHFGSQHFGCSKKETIRTTLEKKKRKKKKIPGCLKKLESEFCNMAGDQLFVCFFSEVSVKMYSWTPGFLFVSFLAAKNHLFLRFSRSVASELQEEASSLSSYIYFYIYLPLICLSSWK